LSIWHTQRVWEEIELPDPEWRVLMAIADSARSPGDQYEHLVWIGVSFLEWKCSYSRRTVQRALSSLREREILIEVAPARQHKPPTYRLDLSKAPPKAPRPRGVNLTPLADPGASPVTPGASADVLRGVSADAQTIKNHQEPSNNGEIPAAGQASLLDQDDVVRVRARVRDEALEAIVTDGLVTLYRVLGKKRRLDTKVAENDRSKLRQFLVENPEVATSALSDRIEAYFASPPEWLREKSLKELHLGHMIGPRARFHFLDFDPENPPSPPAASSGGRESQEEYAKRMREKYAGVGEAMQERTLRFLAELEEKKKAQKARETAEAGEGS
jgi:hypothetical protein